MTEPIALPRTPGPQSLMFDRAALIQQAENTRLSYAADWKIYRQWCEYTGRTAVPSTIESVILYLTELLSQGRAINTVMQHVAAIRDRHRQARLVPPAGDKLRQFLRAACRVYGKPPRQKKPISVAQLRLMTQAVRGCPAVQARNRAIFTLGFASALRRSSLVALDLADVEFRPEGLTLRIRREKQDQQGKGRMIGVATGAYLATCPVRAVQGWLEFRGHAAGPLFGPTFKGHVLIRRLAGERIARAVKAGIKAIGLDERNFGAHSLRSGMVTAAIEAGVGEITIMRQTGHSSTDMLLRYYRGTDPFKANPSGLLGL